MCCRVPARPSQSPGLSPSVLRETGPGSAADGAWKGLEDAGSCPHAEPLAVGCTAVAAPHRALHPPCVTGPARGAVTCECFPAAAGSCGLMKLIVLLL